MVLAYVMVLACVMLLAHVMVLAHVLVQAVSHGLSAQSAPWPPARGRGPETSSISIKIDAVKKVIHCHRLLHPAHYFPLSCPIPFQSGIPLKGNHYQQKKLTPVFQEDIHLVFKFEDTLEVMCEGLFHQKAIFCTLEYLGPVNPVQ